MITNGLSGSSLEKRPADPSGCTTARHRRPPGSSTRADSRIAPAASVTSWSDMNADDEIRGTVGERQIRGIGELDLDRRVRFSGRLHHRRRTVDADHRVAARLEVS